MRTFLCADQYQLERYCNQQGSKYGGMQLILDLTLKRESEFVLEAPAYHVHYFAPDKNLITHVVVVKSVDGPYLFEEQYVIRSQQPYTLFYP